MKRILLMTAIMLFSTCFYGQNWSLLGNPLSPGQFFGSTNNFSLLFRTNNINRIKINPNISYSINGLAGNRNGFMLLSNNPTATSWGIGNSPMATNNFGAFSLLHLIGDDSPFVQEGGKIC